MEHSVFMDKVQMPTESDLKQAPESARVYAEGRGVRIPVPDNEALMDFCALIDIKLAF